ncbi:hypothetical protein Z946_1385 [Sulfitobacter noctilucicola]|nr:hypothetical protein Z946_1385 [Sulfitobacter noctilucicola]
MAAFATVLCVMQNQIAMVPGDFGAAQLLVLKSPPQMRRHIQ